MTARRHLAIAAVFLVALAGLQVPSSEDPSPIQDAEAKEVVAYTTGALTLGTALNTELNITMYPIAGVVPSRSTPQRQVPDTWFAWVNSVPALPTGQVQFDVVFDAPDGVSTIHQGTLPANLFGTKDIDNNISLTGGSGFSIWPMVGETPTRTVRLHFKTTSQLSAPFEFKVFMFYAFTTLKATP